MKTFQLTTAKWLFNSRDRDGGHRHRLMNAAARQQLMAAATDN